MCGTALFSAGLKAPSCSKRNRRSGTGTINPGTDDLVVKNATLNPEGWTVHLEADAKDKAGKAITYVIDGKIENLPLAQRSITGTWKAQGETGPFKISRQ